ncbi:MAG: tail fiber domain-containing protein, partial [Bacteroidota bacterium]
SHANLLAPDPTNANVYTMRIFDDGRVDINAPTSESIRFYQGGTQVRMAVQANTGNVVVGAAASANIGGVRFYVSGNAAKTSGGTTWIVGSDMRLKKDVTTYEDGLEMLKKINPIKFKYNGKAGTVDGEENVGLSGQEIEQVAPYMVSKAQVKMNEDDAEESEVLMLDSSPLMYMAVNAIKELSARVEALEQQLAAQ